MGLNLSPAETKFARALDDAHKEVAELRLALAASQGEVQTLRAIIAKDDEIALERDVRIRSLRAAVADAADTAEKALARLQAMDPIVKAAEVMVDAWLVPRAASTAELEDLRAAVVAYRAATKPKERV